MKHIESEKGYQLFYVALTMMMMIIVEIISAELGSLFTFFELTTWERKLFQFSSPSIGRFCSSEVFEA